MRNHYWTSSRFADWLRGTKSPKAETSDGWRLWEKKARMAHPVRYWLADQGLDYLQTIFYWPTDQLYSLKYYVNNRFITRTHQLTAHARDIAPGSWCDVGNRFLPCLFNELRDFVEVELAWWHIAWEDREAKSRYEAPFWATGWWRVRTWRCPRAGLDNLEWQAQLVDDDGRPTRQAEAAREIQQLYHWWNEVRPARPDAMEVSGWRAYCDARRAADPEHWLTGDDKIDTRPMLDQMHAMEEHYEMEDEAMLIRLIKIRQALWT